MTWATTRRWRREVATVEISEDQAQLLEELSARDNVPPSRLVTAALAAYFGKKASIHAAPSPGFGQTGISMAWNISAACVTTDG